MTNEQPNVLDDPCLEQGRCPTCNLKTELAAVPVAFEFNGFTSAVVLVCQHCSACGASHAMQEAQERARLQALALLIASERVSPELLAAVRQGLELTQQELGSRIGIPASCVRRWEAGKVLLPSWLPLALLGLTRERLIGPELVQEHDLDPDLLN